MTVPRPFGQNIVSENVISAPQADGGRKTKLLEEVTQINPPGAILPVVLMNCTQPLTLSHQALLGPTPHSLETSRQD